MVPFTPVNSFPHLLGREEAGGGKRGRRRKRREEGKKTALLVVISFGISVLVCLLLLAEFKGGWWWWWWRVSTPCCHFEPLCQKRALKWLHLTNATMRLTSTSLFSSFISLSSISSLTVHQLSFEPPPMHYAFTNKEDVAVDKQPGAPASPERIRLHRHFSLVENYTSRRAFSPPLSHCFTFHPYSLYIQSLAAHLG